MEIKDYLKYYREKSNLTQTELADLIYVTRQAVSKWERKESYPDIENIILLSDLYDMPIDQLLRGAKFLKKPHQIGHFTPKKKFIIISCIVTFLTILFIFMDKKLLALYTFITFMLINLLMVKNDGVILRRHSMEIIHGYSYFKQLRLIFEKDFKDIEYTYKEIDSIEILYLHKKRLSPYDY